MGVAFSAWEMGRSTSSGQIVSMTPLDLGRSFSSLGANVLAPAGLALAAVAQFGVFYELHKMNAIQSARFEERRHAWIENIASQWIDEHKGGSGIKRDISEAVARECEKMWEKVCDNGQVDVPQTLLLRINRMSEYLDANYLVLANGVNRLVLQSGSPSELQFDSSGSSEKVCEAILEERVNEQKAGWWKGLLTAVAGLPMFLIPGIGLFAGGAAIGAGVTDMVQRLRLTAADLERIREFMPLLRFSIALVLVEEARKSLHYILDHQKWNSPARFVIAEPKPGEIQFGVEPVRKPLLPWFGLNKASFNFSPVAVPEMVDLA